MESRVKIEPDIFTDLSIQFFPERIPYLGFESKSEVCCAILMERYIKGWQCVVEQTYQVPLIQGRRADFLIGNDIVFEYHPISLHRDMMSDDARHSIERNLKHTKKWVAEEIKDAIRNELYMQYYARRQAITRATVGFETAELIVATDVKGFWRKIIQRFCDKPIGIKQLTYEWNDIMKAVSK